MLKKVRLLLLILRQTGADTVLSSFIGTTMVSALVIWLVEPDIHTYTESLWYCFTVISTIGFGDVVVHTPIARVVSILLSFYAVLALAIVTGVVVNYFNQITELRRKDSLASLMEKLEHLPSLSREELKNISEQIRHKMGHGGHSSG